MTIFVNLAPINLPLTTSDVIVRELQAGDVPALYDVDADPDVKFYLDGPIATPREAWITKLQTRCPTTLTLAVCDRVDGTFLGRASMQQCLPHMEPKVELEIVLGRAAWGRHLGRQVACALILDAWRRNATMVIAKTHPDNTHAHALLKEFGFAQMGIVSSTKLDNCFLEFYLAHDAHPCR